MSEALEEVKEASARADAKRAIAKDKDMKQNPFSKDTKANATDQAAAGKNIIMQLRKSITMRGQKEVEFEKGSYKVNPKIAQAVQDKFNKIKRPEDKEKFQDKIAKSYKDLLLALKEEYELNEEPASPDEGSMAVQQLEFMMHAVERTKMHIQSGGEFPEWMQNKLSGAHEKLKGLYANIEHGDMNEELDLDEMKMDDPKLLKMFDKLKKGSKIKLKTSSTISQGKDYVEYIVKSKNLVNKGRVEKITLATVGNEKAVKKFLYKRDGTVGFAIGDMGASIDDIKEGTWALPDSPKAKAELKKLMSKPIKLGKEGDEASDKLYALIGDDELFDDLYVAGKKNPNGDARDVVKKHMKRLGIKEEVELDEKFVDKDPQGKKFGWVIFNTKTNELIAKHDDKKTIEKMKQRYERMGEPVTMMTFSKAFQYNEEVELDEMREPYAVVDTADGNKVVGTASDEKGAKSIITSSELPPMKIKDKKTLKIVKVKKKQMIGQPIKEEEELDEAPKMTYALVGTDMKIYSMGSDERDLRLDRKSLEKRFKDVAPLKMARLKTAQSIGDKVDKSQLKEEEGEPDKPDTAKAVDQGREDKKKTRIAQLQLQIAKAQETINKLNAQEKPNG
jgi:hypothetical protein